jgi:hypothetical protein
VAEHIGNGEDQKRPSKDHGVETGSEEEVDSKERIETPLQLDRWSVSDSTAEAVMQRNRLPEGRGEFQRFLFMEFQQKPANYS